MKKTSLLACIFVIVDYISKILVTNLLLIDESVPLIGNFLQLTYVRNTGAAFSIFSNYTYVLACISIFVILLILYYIYKKDKISRIESLCYGLILGGATGNLIDRVIYGYVIDFIDVNIFNHNFPIFNLADSFIVLAFILLIILEIKKDILVKKGKK
jgi:signal peptidase II